MIESIRVRGRRATRRATARFLRPEAGQDLASARDWYDQQRAGLGDEFLDALALALRVLARDPELPRFYHQKFRRVMLRRFPYKIFYQVVSVL